jgi:hypothetical protein
MVFAYVRKNALYLKDKPSNPYYVKGANMLDCPQRGPMSRQIKLSMLLDRRNVFLFFWGNKGKAHPGYTERNACCLVKGPYRFGSGIPRNRSHELSPSLEAHNCP